MAGGDAPGGERRPLEITIQHRRNGVWPVVASRQAVKERPASRFEGELRLDPEKLDSLEGDRLAYGQMLGKVLFSKSIQRALDDALQQDQPVHVLLAVEAPELKALRWESLCIQVGERWGFLRLEPRLPYAFHLAGPVDDRFAPIGRRDLRALIVAASPAVGGQVQLAPFSVESAVAAARRGLDGMPGVDGVAGTSGVAGASGVSGVAGAPGVDGVRCDVLAALPGAIGAPTLDALCEALTNGRYTLLHVVCHGALEQVAEPGGGAAGRSAEVLLFLGAAGGGVEPVTATRFIDRLAGIDRSRRLPRFVFLSACETAHPEANLALGGLAQRLVLDLGVPAVVAMTDRVAVTLAESLSSSFYTRLREHGLVDLALVEACAGIAGCADVQHEQRGR